MSSSELNPSEDIVIGYTALPVLESSNEGQSASTTAIETLKSYAEHHHQQLIDTFIDFDKIMAFPSKLAFETCLQEARDKQCPILILNAHHLPKSILEKECSDISFIIAEIGEAVSFDTIKLLHRYHSVQSTPIFHNAVAPTSHILQIGLGQNLAAPENIQYLTSSIKRFRDRFEQDHGWSFPPVHIYDDLNVDANTYYVKIKNQRLANFQLHPERILALSTDAPPPPLKDGIATLEPAFQIPAFWIPKHGTEEAIQAGYTLIKPMTVLTTHVTELIQHHKKLLFTARSFQDRYAQIQQNYAELTDLLVECGITTGRLHRVFYALVQHNIPLTDDHNMLLALTDSAYPGFRHEDLVLAARRGLKDPICQMLTDDYGAIPTVKFTAALESEFNAALNDDDEAIQQWARETIEALLKERYDFYQSPQAILLCGSSLAQKLRLYFSTSTGIFSIFSPDELPHEAPIEILEVLGVQAESNAQSAPLDS